MVNRLFITWISLLALAAGAARAQAGAPGWRVTPFPLNAPAPRASWYAARPSPLTRGLTPQGGYFALYAAEVWPGEAYTLQMRVPADTRRARIYLFDRWPLLPGARRISLPAGPVVAVAGRKSTTCRWRIGIAPRSTGFILYLLIRSPHRPGERHRPGPRLALFSPALSPRNRIGRGITYLQGPQALLLLGGGPPPQALLSSGDETEPTPRRRSGPGSGDWLRNGSFRQGLRDWELDGVPSRAFPEQGGVVLLARQAGELSLTQHIDRAVPVGDDLLLTGEIRLGRRKAAAATRLSFTLCYRDDAGRRICGRAAELARFGTRGLGTGDPQARRIPADEWIPFRFALRRLPHRAARLLFLTIHAAGAGPAWVRELHLRKGDSHGQRHSHP